MVTRNVENHHSLEKNLRHRVVTKKSIPRDPTESAVAERDPRVLEERERYKKRTVIIAILDIAQSSRTQRWRGASHPDRGSTCSARPPVTIQSLECDLSPVTVVDGLMF